MTLHYLESVNREKMKDAFFFTHDFGARNDPNCKMYLWTVDVRAWVFFLVHRGTLPLSNCKSIAFVLHVEYNIVERIIKTMNEELTGYELSRNWFDFCFENTDLITPTHTAVYFFCIEHCNRLGWKNKFGLPTQIAMEAIGVKNWRTYIKAFNDIVDWGFINLIQKSKNQYSSNIIAIVKNTKALSKANTPANTEAAIVKNTKALSKAIQKHSQKQRSSIVDINKQLKPNNNLNQLKEKLKDFSLEFVEKDFEKVFYDWLDYKYQRKEMYKTQKSLEACYKMLKKLSYGDTEIAEAIIEQSMASNWAGLFTLKNEIPAKTENTQNVNDIWQK
jgi:hypothetical protein